MKILYGKNNNYLDITNYCLLLLSTNNTINIPKNDINRARIFGDPCRGIVKDIIVEQNNEKTIYNDKEDITIKHEPTKINLDILDPKLKILHLHKKLLLRYGKKTDEFQEQMLSVKHIKSNDNVLEIGGNIGRNSLVIASLLNNSSNLVVLESDTHISSQLDTNRKINNFNFKIINAALSKNKLIQRKWKTILSNKLLHGYKWVPIINFNELKEMTKIKFNVLVLDCEGAFYYILKDFPEILEGITKIIIENDFMRNEHKDYVSDILKLNKFKVIDSLDLNFKKRYRKDFYEVWFRDLI